LEKSFAKTWIASSDKWLGKIMILKSEKKSLLELTCNINCLDSSLSKYIFQFAANIFLFIF
jgi:hypothetical protein